MEALLSSIDDYTVLRCAGKQIKMKAPYSLVRYTEVVDWDDGLITVKAEYNSAPFIDEDYIDLRPVLTRLYINADEFIKNIEKVRICYD